MTPELDSTLIKLANIAAVLAVAYVVRIAVEGLLDIVDYLRGPRPAAGDEGRVFVAISHHPSSDADDPNGPSEGPNKNPDGWKN